MWDYKPCRLSNCYKIEENHIILLSVEGISKLESAAAFLWEHFDGNHTIEQLLDLLCEKYKQQDKEVLLKGLISVLEQLRRKGALIINWDPLLKGDMPQEVVING